MALIKVEKNFQITLPNNLRRTLKIAVGDYLEMEKQDNELVLKPVKMIHPDQAYFYTQEWQEGESQADRDLERGDVLGPFENLKKGLKALKTAKL